MIRPTLALLFVALGCGGSLPQPYATESAFARQAYARSDYATAAEHWRNALALAPNARERDEARYRLAATLERAGRVDEAISEYAGLERTGGERAARSAFDRAKLVLAHRDQRAGVELLRSALRRYPNTGPAQAALRRWISHIEVERGPSAAVLELKELHAQLRATELAEALLFELGTLLVVLGRSDEARETFLELARQFPYPQGAYWDDALMRAAELDLADGRYTDAIARLERLLAAREAARGGGSYERAAFADARYRIAEIYRDYLGDAGRARQHFRRVFEEHATSRRGDDALFQEALLALTSDRRAACDAARLIQERLPESRYAACADLLCPHLDRLGKCRGYIRRAIEDARVPEPDRAPDHATIRRPRGSRRPPRRGLPRRRHLPRRRLRLRSWLLF